MKKFISVFVAVVFCFAMLATSASAASFGNLSTDEIAQILGVDAGDLSALDDLASNLESLDLNANASSSSDASAIVEQVLSTLDLNALAESLVGGEDALASLTNLLSSGEGSSFDISALTDMISGAFGGAGFDLSSLTSGLDLGSFDISSILSGIGGAVGGGSGDASGGAAGGATDMLSGLMDKLMGGLSSLGLDTSMIEGLLDNDIVNFFANLYIGLGGAGGDEGGETVTTTAAPTTTAPVVVTTSTPKTGDTSAVIVALGTICAASAAAFVCLKKKND